MDRIPRPRGPGSAEVRRACYFAPNSGLAYDSRYPHFVHRNVAVGMDFSAGTLVPHMSDFCASPSTQWLTAIWWNEWSTMKPRIISPPHFRHVNLSALMATLPF